MATEAAIYSSSPESTLWQAGRGAGGRGEVATCSTDEIGRTPTIVRPRNRGAGSLASPGKCLPHLRIHSDGEGYSGGSLTSPHSESTFPYDQSRPSSPPPSDSTDCDTCPERDAADSSNATVVPGRDDGPTLAHSSGGPEVGLDGDPVASNAAALYTQQQLAWWWYNAMWQAASAFYSMNPAALAATCPYPQILHHHASWWMSQQHQQQQLKDGPASVGGMMMPLFYQHLAQQAGLMAAAAAAAAAGPRGESGSGSDAVAGVGAMGERGGERGGGGGAGGGCGAGRACADIVHTGLGPASGTGNDRALLCNESINDKKRPFVAADDDGAGMGGRGGGNWIPSSPVPNGVRKRPRPGETKICSNCSTNATPFWRKDKHGGGPLCNACGLYYAKNDAPRPRILWRKAGDV